MLDGPRFGPKSGGKPQQLVVICHGLGADGQDLIELAPALAPALPDAAFVAPDGPERLDQSPIGRQWFSLSDRTPAKVEAGMRRAAPVLSAFIAAELARLGLPEDAYALMGFSQGAMTVLFTGLRQAIAPRAIIAYSGALVAAETLAAEITGRPPVLLVHGEIDEVVPIAASRGAEAVLRACAVPVETMWVKNLGHGIDASGIAAGGLFLKRAFAA